MYKIIGADGKEYGPISADQVRQWVAEGRANAQTQVLAEGTTDWKRLGDFPEFASAAIPVTPAYAPQPGFQTDARQKVNGPAIGLIVYAVIALLGNVVSLIFSLGAGSTRDFSQPGMSPEMERFMATFTSGAYVLASGALGMIIGGLILFGAIKMKKCESYGLAMTASILALLPCNCPCCLIGIPMGIWALVVLSKPEVKSAFH